MAPAKGWWFHRQPMEEETMSQLGTTQAGAALAATGAMATGFAVVGAWTLVVAGLALVTIARVLRRRHASQP